MGAVRLATVGPFPRPDFFALAHPIRIFEGAVHIVEDRRQRNPMQQQKSLFLSNLCGDDGAIAGMAFAIPEVDKFLSIRGSVW